MINKIEDIVKTRQKQAAENLEVTWFENSLIFKIDNKLILGINTLTNSTSLETLSITLSFYGKYQCLEIESASNNDVQPSKNTVLLATSFREFITALSMVLKDSRNSIISASPAPALLIVVLSALTLPTLALSAPTPPVPVSTAPLSTIRNKFATYKHCINKVKSKLKNKMREIKNKMKKILQSVASQQATVKNSVVAN